MCVSMKNWGKTDLISFPVEEKLKWWGNECQSNRGIQEVN